MKKYLLLISIFTSTGLFAQHHNTKSKNSYGIIFGLGKSDIWTTVYPKGGSGYRGSNCFDLGINYDRYLSNYFDFEGSLVYHHNHIKITPNFYPGMDMTPKYYRYNLIYMPLDLRYKIHKYFFMNAGLIVDFDVNNDRKITNQTGLGTNFGLGLNLPIFRQIDICINPYLNIHRLVGFYNDNYQQRLFDTGISLKIRRYHKAAPNN